MSVELSEEQNDILKELRILDPDQLFRGIPEISVQATASEEQKEKPSQIDMFFEVDYDTEHSAIREKLLNYRRKSEQIYRVGELLKDY